VDYFLTTTMSAYEDAPPRYNIAGAYEVDNLELAQRVAAILNQKLRVNFVDVRERRPGHDVRYALDGSKLAALGWRPTVPFDVFLERTVRWYANNREWL